MSQILPAWRINHPSEALSVGQSVEVQVIRFNQETQRISLGMKQLLSDPWESAAEKYQIGTKLNGYQYHRLWRIC